MRNCAELYFKRQREFPVRRGDPPYAEVDPAYAAKRYGRERVRAFAQSSVFLIDVNGASESYRYWIQCRS